MLSVHHTQHKNPSELHNATCPPPKGGYIWGRVPIDDACCHIEVNSMGEFWEASPANIKLIETQTHGAAGGGNTVT